MSGRNDTGVKRILVLAEDLKPGGATVVLLRLLPLLRSEGHDVICITADEISDFDAAYGISHDPLAAKGGWGLRGRLREVLPSRRLLRLYSPDLVIVHAVSPGYFAAMMYQDLPCLYYFHSVIEAQAGNSRRRLYSRIARHSTRIAAVSTWHRENITTNWGVPRDTIRLLPNYPDRQVSMKTEGDILLTAGRFHWSKNPAAWIEVGRRMDEVLSARGLSMIWCAPSMDDEGRRMIADLPARLTVVVDPSRQQLDDYFSRALLYYQPSAVEPQGIAVLEAMQNGIPCIVTTDTGMLDAVTDGRTGLVVPQQDTAAHVTALRCLLDDPARAARLGLAGRDFITEHFNRLQWERKVLDTVSELAGAGQQIVS